ncbi:MAG: xanthine dehydrogenase family protein molybdopterin-binding subunit, partial [Gemmatimonadales bacterium]
MTSIMGSGIRRREDPRLITGAATYTDDIKLPGLTYAAFLRSPYAHAKITKIDTSLAKAAPGVVAVYTGADVNPHVLPVLCAWNPPNCDLKVPPHPVLAQDKVRYVGDAVAMVVAETRAQARDAIDLIDVDYDTLPAEADP